MKIMLVADSMGIGGAETHVLSLARGLSREGDTVIVVAKRGELCERLISEDIRFIEAYPKSRSVFGMLSYTVDLWRIIRKERPEVIHSHSRPTAFAVGVGHLFGLARGAAFVVTAHAKYKINGFFKLLSVWGEECIAVSEDIKEYLEKNYRPRLASISVIPNGIDTDDFSPRGEPLPHTILFASRLDEDCSLGADCLCEIADRLSAKYPDLKINIAGGGEELERLKSKAQGIKCVTFLGGLSSISDVVSESSVVIGVSRTVLEGMASEKNVILFGNEGALGILTPKNIGIAEATNFTCRGSCVQDSDFLFREICELFDMNIDEREAVAMANREYIVKKHSANEVVESTVKIYSRALESKRRIVIGGYYGFSNMGDEMLKASVVKWLDRAAPHTHVTVLNKSGKREGRVRYVCRYSPRVLFELCSADVFILGGGSLLQNSTSTRSLFYYCALIFIAKALGCKVILLSNGIGPLNGKLANQMAARAIRRADRVSLRDEESYRLAKSLGKADAVLGGDLSFSFELPVLTNKALREGEYLLIALKGDGKFDRTPLLKKIDALCKERGLIPIFVAMDQALDGKAARRFAEMTNGEFLECETAEEMLSHIFDAWAVMGDRLHFIIFALIVGKSFVGVGDAPKVKSFVSDSLGMKTLNPYLSEELDGLVDEARSFSSAELFTVYERYKSLVSADLMDIERSFLDF